MPPHALAIAASDGGGGAVVGGVGRGAGDEPHAATKNHEVHRLIVR
jgi:hypothetical protein